MAKHPENKGDRSPLTSRKLKRELRGNRIVKKSSPRAGTEVDLPAGPKPEIPAQQPMPQQIPQPPQGDPVQPTA